MASTTTPEENKRIQSHEVTGGGGITLHVDETGNEDGRPILFIHGFSQSLQSWDKQMHSDLADDFRLVAMDNRGHGWSEKPRDAYDDPELWADDVQGVIDALGLDRPALVGWSAGGGIISDYLEVHGEDDVAGANFVGAGPFFETEDPLTFVGEDFISLVPGFQSTDVDESIEALETFVRRLYDDPSPPDLYYLFGFTTIVPPYVREGLLSREPGHDKDLFASLDIPVLITHAEEDTIFLPSAAEGNADLIPNAEISWYSEAGHSMFWEVPERFNRELREFVSGL